MTSSSLCYARVCTRVYVQSRASNPPRQFPSPFPSVIKPSAASVQLRGEIDLKSDASTSSSSYGERKKRERERERVDRATTLRFTLLVLVLPCLLMRPRRGVDNKFVDIVCTQLASRTFTFFCVAFGHSIFRTIIRHGC